MPQDASTGMLCAVGQVTVTSPRHRLLDSVTLAASPTATHSRRVTLGAKAPHSKGDLSPMTEKTQKSKVVVLVKHTHTHTHPHTRLLDFSGYPPSLVD